MSKSPERGRIKADLTSKQGSELVNAIADELADLHAQMHRIEERLRLLPIYQDFSEKLGLLAECGIGQEELPDKLRIEASHLLAADGGFYGIEYDTGGRAYRWTGPRRDFYFVLYLDRRTPIRLELELGRMADPNVQKNLSLLADGKPVPLQLEIARSTIVASATLPTITSARATSLIFVVPALVPETDGINVRQLGVAFRELRLHPAQLVAGAEHASSNICGSDGRETLSWLMAPDVSQPSGAANAAAIALAGDGQLSGGGHDRRHGLGDKGDHPLPRVVRIGAEDVEDGTAGFFPLETDRSGHSHRWTGPGRTFAFTVRVDRSRPLSVKLCFVQFVSRDTQAPVTVRIGDMDRELELMNGADGIIGHTIIPAADSMAPTTLTFAVRSALRPGNADRRSLGLAFRYLVLEPASRARVLKLRSRIKNAMKQFARIVLKRGARIGAGSPALRFALSSCNGDFITGLIAQQHVRGR